MATPSISRKRTDMIARLWSARTHLDGADAYAALFPIHVLADLDGFHGAYLLRRDDGTTAELITITLFESMDAIRGFAGDDPERANVSGPAREVLTDVDEHVRHFTVMLAR